VVNSKESTPDARTIDGHKSWLPALFAIVLIKPPVRAPWLEATGTLAGQIVMGGYLNPRIAIIHGSGV